MILDKETICHFLIWGRTFIWSLLQKEVIYQSQGWRGNGGQSEVAWLMPEVSCKASFNALIAYSTLRVLGVEC